MQINDNLKAVLIAGSIITFLIIILAISMGHVRETKEATDPYIQRTPVKKRVVRPREPVWVTCPKCNGTGYDECWRCRGRGTGCRGGQGKKEHDFHLEHTTVIVKCGRCNGTGDAGDICPTCNGTGRSPYDKCWKCSGTGKVRR